MQFTLDRRQLLEGILAVGGAAALAGLPKTTPASEAAKTLEKVLKGGDSLPIRGIVKLLSPSGRVFKGSEREVTFIAKAIDDTNVTILSKGMKFDNLESGTISHALIEIPEVLTSLIPLGEFYYIAGSTFFLYTGQNHDAA